jgi:hypothetical protein
MKFFFITRSRLRIHELKVRIRIWEYMQVLSGSGSIKNFDLIKGKFWKPFQQVARPYQDQRFATFKIFDFIGTMKDLNLSLFGSYALKETILTQECEKDRARFDCPGLSN